MINTQYTERMIVRYFCLLLIVFMLIVNSSCTESNDSQIQTKELTFSQATNIAKEYLIESGHHNLSALDILEEPNNDFWNAYSSPYPEMLEDYGLKDKDYYAVMFTERVRDGGAIVFIDKNEKKVIGVLYGSQYEKN